MAHSIGRELEGSDAQAAAGLRTPPETGAETPSGGWLAPGEFEAQAAVWLGWPAFQWFEDRKLDTRATIAEIACALSDYEVPSNVMCTDEEGVRAARDWMLRNGYAVSSRIRFLKIPQADLWVRDYGPIFLRNRRASSLSIASFKQNQWGHSTTADPVSRAMSELPGRVAEFLGMDRVLCSALVSEGGNRIGNGRGVLVVNRSIELERNPGATLEDLEAAYKRVLGARKVIWLNSGLKEDMSAERGPIPYFDTDGELIHLYNPQTTGGHADEFCQFAGPRRIVLAQVADEEAAEDPIAAANYARLEEAYRVLSEETDQDGRPFEIIRIPTPDVAFRRVRPEEPMYCRFLEELEYAPDAPPFPKGEPVHIVRVSSYANYLATNGMIIAPYYGNPDKDAAAARALESAYPGRDLVPIDPTPLNYVGGGIHCATQQQPVGACRRVP